MTFEDPFFIAEVGANHQGSVDLAMEYIKIFSKAGASAIKFQVRDNQFLFSKQKYNEPYNGNNSFGPTYGAHREALELKFEDLRKLKICCAENGVKFMVTAFDENSLETLREIGVDVLKIASFDLGNIPFLHRAAAIGKPVVLSCGGGKKSHVEISINALRQVDPQLPLAVLHCVSEYPCDPERLRLGNITDLVDSFPDCVIGISDHFSGTLSGPMAAILGAQVFEKHVTFNRAWKGTDHSFALEEQGFTKFVRDVKRVPLMRKNGYNDNLGNEQVFQKLGKQTVANCDIQRGQILEIEFFRGQITGVDALPIREAYSLVGKRASRDICIGEIINVEDAM